MQPVLLRPDNFTSPARTPWGGRRIAGELKRDLAVPHDAVVGESWELSSGPELASRCEADGVPFAARVASDPAQWLGREHRAGRNLTALLVKLLDTVDELSLQIHPADDYKGLARTESGKPESWYVLRADPGAGVYLGLAQGVTRAHVEEALGMGGRLQDLLAFVPVFAGDFFLIAAGTPHAIGRGVTLVEPQRVKPGHIGVTYRYWDWNRRYDRHGRLDPAGESRPLQCSHALNVTTWSAPRGVAYLATHSVRAGAPALDGEARIDMLCSKEGPVVSKHLQVARAAGTGEIDLPVWDALVAITVVEGSVELLDVTIARGRTAAVPAALGGAPMRLAGAHAIVSAVYP